MAKIEREFAVGGPCTNCGLVRFESNGERLLRSATPGWTTPCRWCEAWRANDDELWPAPSELPASATYRSLVQMLEGRAAMLDRSTAEGASLYSDLMEAADVICKLSANEQAFMTQVDALNAVLVTYDRWDMRLTLVDNVRRVCQNADATAPDGHTAVMLPTALVAGRARMVGFYGMGTFADVIATACADAMRAQPCLCTTAADIGAPEEYGGDRVIAHVHPECPLHGDSAAAIEPSPAATATRESLAASRCSKTVPGIDSVEPWPCSLLAGHEGACE